MNRTKASFTYPQLAADLSSIFLELQIRTQELEQRETDCALVQEELIKATSRLSAQDCTEEEPMTEGVTGYDVPAELTIEIVQKAIEDFFADSMRASKEANKYTEDRS